MRGVLLKHWFEGKTLSGVFHSTLARARETAVYLGGRISSVEDLQELGVGEWEGMTIDEIRAEYPDLYQNRIKYPTIYRIPGGEAASACRNRVARALENLLESTEGDIAVAAHAGVNRILLCDLTGQSLKNYLTVPQPYGCVNVIREDRSRLAVQEIAIRPRPTLNEVLCQELLVAAGTPEPVIRHCKAVTEKAMALADALMRTGATLDRERLRAAALLHDVARTERNHAAAGAQWLIALGYPEMAELIAAHHDLSPERETEISEATVLYLADKLVQEDREVTMERRFADSFGRISGVEGREAHARRYQQARRVAQNVERQLRVGI